MSIFMSRITLCKMFYCHQVGIVFTTIPHGEDLKSNIVTLIVTSYSCSKQRVIFRIEVQKGQGCQSRFSVAYALEINSRYGKELVLQQQKVAVNPYNSSVDKMTCSLSYLVNDSGKQNVPKIPHIK